MDALLKRCQEGDQRAWSLLVLRFQSLVYSVARRHGLSADDSADVFQQTFQALYSSLDRIHYGQGLPKWLAVTASRESIRIRRCAVRTSVAELEDLEGVIAADDASAEASAIEACDADVVRRAVADLPGRCRDLLSMLYFEEASYAEICERLGTPIGAIGPTRARCLDKLRANLRTAGFFNGDVSQPTEDTLKIR